MIQTRFLPSAVIVLMEDETLADLRLRRLLAGSRDRGAVSGQARDPGAGEREYCGLALVKVDRRSGRVPQLMVDKGDRRDGPSFVRERPQLVVDGTEFIDVQTSWLAVCEPEPTDPHRGSIPKRQRAPRTLRNRKSRQPFFGSWAIKLPRKGADTGTLLYNSRNALGYAASVG